MKGPYVMVTVDGKNIETMIVGVKGKACEKIQKQFKPLGKQTHDGMTSEYVQSPAQTVAVPIHARS